MANVHQILPIAIGTRDDLPSNVCWQQIHQHPCVEIPTEVGNEIPPLPSGFINYMKALEYFRFIRGDHQNVSLSLPPISPAFVQTMNTVLNVSNGAEDCNSYSHREGQNEDEMNTILQNRNCVRKRSQPTGTDNSATLHFRENRKRSHTEDAESLAKKQAASKTTPHSIEDILNKPDNLQPNQMNDECDKSKEPTDSVVGQGGRVYSMGNSLINNVNPPPACILAPQFPPTTGLFMPRPALQPAPMSSFAMSPQWNLPNWLTSAQILQALTGIGLIHMLYSIFSLLFTSKSHLLN